MTRIRMNHCEIDNYVRKNFLVKSETMPLGRESGLVTKFPISREDRLPFDVLPGSRSLHLRIISHAAHAAKVSAMRQMR